MALVHKSHSLPGLALVLLAATAIPQAKAATEELERYQSLCKQNVLCSVQATNDGLLFKVRKTGRTETLVCQADGSCEVMMPRGGRYTIKNVEVRLSAK